MGTWTADITTDPDRDYALYVELLEDDRHRGRVERAPDGMIQVVWYEPVAVPWEWLAGIVARFKTDG